MELPNLTSVSLSSWQFDSLQIRETGLESLDGLDVSQVRCNLLISKNPALKDISFLQQSKGQSSAQFYVTDNPALASRQVQAVVAALPAPDVLCDRNGELGYGSRDVEVSGNDDTATCP